MPTTQDFSLIVHSRKYRGVRGVGHMLRFVYVVAGIFYKCSVHHAALKNRSHFVSVL